MPVWQTVTVALAPLPFCNKYADQRLADNIAAAHNDHVFAIGIVAASDQQFLDAVRGGRVEGLLAKEQFAGAYRIGAIDVLVRRYGAFGFEGVQLLGQRAGTAEYRGLFESALSSPIFFRSSVWVIVAVSLTASVSNADLGASPGDPAQIR